MADAFVSVILEQLTSIIREQVEQELRLVVGVDKEIHKLTSNLRAIQAVCDDAERRQVKDELVKQWLDNLKHTAYEIEDVLDEWNTAIFKMKMINESASQQEKKVCSFIPFSCVSFNQVALRRDIAVKIKQVNEALDEIAIQKDRYSFNSVRGIEEPKRCVPASSAEKHDRLMTTCIIDESKIVGRRKEKDRLIQMLLCESNQGPTLCIISIVGMGGIGKTTLAQQAYNDCRVMDQFEERIWVCVSDPFDVMRVAKAILEGLKKSAPNLSELNSLLLSISESIKGKKFFLVLDDVWSEDYRKWEQLQSSLHYGLPGSTILVTTRNERVANIMESSNPLLLGKLPDVEFLELFSRVAFFGWTDEERERVEELGHEVAKKCGGLPLAAKTLGSLLRRKKARKEWLDILDSGLWKEVGKDLFPPLLLSYYDLSSELKRCFSYCAIFPKDHRIEKNALIQLWMSHGCLGLGNSTTTEINGNEYFNELAMRSFFQDFIRDKWGRIVSCKMHDIVHDLAQYLTKNECFAMEVNSAIEPGIEASYAKARHLIMKLSMVASIPLFICNLKNLRTLKIEAFMNEIRYESLVEVFNNLTCLRSLDLSHSLISELPGEIGKLIHLRNLNLEGCGMITELPETLCDLLNLQTLNVCKCNLIKLPPGLGNLINLVHLTHKGSGDCKWSGFIPRGIAKLTSLHVLDEFCVSYLNEESTMGDLMNLNLLRGRLRITGLRKVRDESDAQKAQLCNKKRLTELVLVFDGGFQRLIEYGDIRRRMAMKQEQVLEALQPPPHLETLHIKSYEGTKLFPNWLTPLTNLREVCFMYCPNCEFLPPLGKLPSLEVLHIRVMNGVKRAGVEFLAVANDDNGGTSSPFSSPIFFPKLRILHFDEMKEWEEWDYTTGEERGVTTCDSSQSIMPRLQQLRIYQCPKLKTLPDHLFNTQSLKTVTIEYCPILKEQLGIPDSHSLFRDGLNNLRFLRSQGKRLDS